MKKIAVLSDTHFNMLPEATALVERLLTSCFSEVDAVIHAGDLVHPELGLLFNGLPFYSVQGNMDSSQPGVPLQRILTIESWRIGVVHGWGPKENLEQRLLEHFASTQLDCLIYGHSHRPVCHRVGEILVVNPGSAADRRSQPWHSVALLYVGETLEAEIINIDAL
ncbi:metallophosphoesterase [uncultured Desulfuromonas sp.]|uniref:metallophosphoesterase family protein n=1 Tax=uncultured Desulfuromonas sp. TaxID=181013 RepID=UPI002AAB755B|nr:metallophosphoesterase [uncultured Desulfuromonas sp.]